MTTVNLDDLSYPYIILDRNLSVKLLNKPLADLFGQPVDELIGGPVESFPWPDQLKHKVISKMPLLINIASSMYDKEDLSKAVIPINAMPFSTVINDKNFEGIISCKVNFDENGLVSELIIWAIPALVNVGVSEDDNKYSGFFDRDREIFYLGHDYGLRYLTIKEFQVFCEILLKGDSDEQISNRLGMSRSTCRVHLRSICSKTGIKTRGELMAKAMDCGWYSIVKSLKVEKTI